MNINFVCVAKSDQGRRSLPGLSKAAIDYAVEIYGPAQDHIFRTESIVAFNADRMGRTWSVPTWLETEQGILAFSQPPVPLDTVVDSASWRQEVVDLVARRQKFGDFVINHFGYWISPEFQVEIWTDIIGFGRCYIVENDDFIAVSNHIGVLSFFLEGDVRIDDVALARFANFGWFSGDSTPYEGIRRVGAAARITVKVDGTTRLRNYMPLGELVGDRGEPVDFQPTVDQTRIVAKNLDSLSHGTPTVYLSGGQDSRMTAGLWLSGGGSANVVTLGVLEPEVAIAKELLDVLRSKVDFEKQGIVHRVTHPTPTGVTMSIEDRLQKAFEMWDGDAAPTNIKTNVRRPGAAGNLAIGGTNGEITHGYFYSRPGLVEQISKLAHPLKRLEKVYSGIVPTKFAHSTLPDFFDSEYDEAAKAGQSGLASLDVFYLREKLRRWHNQSLSSTSTVLLGTKAYIRAAYDLTIQERIDKIAPKTIARMAVPGWDGIDYYKASVGESKVANRKGLRTWNIDKDYLYSTLGNPEIWNRYLNKERIQAFLEMVERDDAVGSHESWFNRAIWLDYFPLHASRLNRRISAARKAAKS